MVNSENIFDGDCFSMQSVRLLRYYKFLFKKLFEGFRRPTHEKDIRLPISITFETIIGNPPSNM